MKSFPLPFILEHEIYSSPTGNTNLSSTPNIHLWPTWHPHHSQCHFWWPLPPHKQKKLGLSNIPQCPSCHTYQWPLTPFMVWKNVNLVVAYYNIFKIPRFCTNITMFGTTLKKGVLFQYFVTLLLFLVKKICFMFPMCSLSHSFTFLNNFTIWIISHLWQPYHLRCDYTWHFFFHHLHLKDLELRHLHCTWASPSWFNISIIVGAHNYYYHGHFWDHIDRIWGIIIQKNVCAKEMEWKNWTTTLKKKIWRLQSSWWWNMRWCHMLDDALLILKEKKRYHHKKWWFYVWIRLPLKKVVVVAPLCESKHGWYLALCWCWWYITFYKRLVQCLNNLTLEVLIPSVKATLILQHLILHTNSIIFKPKLSHTHSLIKT